MGPESALLSTQLAQYRAAGLEEFGGRGGELSLYVAIASRARSIDGELPPQRSGAWARLAQWLRPAGRGVQGRSFAGIVATEVPVEGAGVPLEALPACVRDGQ